MLIKLCFLSLLLKVGHSSQPLREPETELTISECAVKGGECDETKGKPVCGTDNQTYPTRCHLKRAQCSGHPVSIKHSGTCKDACVASRAYAFAHPSSPFVPKCRADGSYAPAQCAKEGSECWCVNSQGKPIPNTTVRTGKPDCGKPGKINRRRSSPRNIPHFSNQSRRPCTKSDRFIFNTNLIKMFNSEYVRTNSSQTTTVTDKIILDWKFSTLDLNNNHLLDRNEYRELKSIIKKAVKPKRCARVFGKFCDKDQDEKLSRQEWGSCLSKEGPKHDSDLPSSSSSFIKSQHVNNFGSKRKYSLDSRLPDVHDYDDPLNVDEDYDDSADPDSILGAADDLPSSRVKPGFMLRAKPLEVSDEGDTNIRDGDGESDCLADRNAALDEQMPGSQPLYIPECTPDGRYQRVQCYTSTGYCWCVHEDTGKNIPGTSTKEHRPLCDAVPQLSRPMKGCPENRKNEFLTELKAFLKTQIISNTNTGIESTNWKTEDEKVATLSFVILDKNKNKLWERKEWKTFRDSITSIKKLRKCGKKMPRYCDVNSDRKITLSEWMNCLDTQRTPVETQQLLNEQRTTNSGKLKGPNPLDSYLKSD